MPLLSKKLLGLTGDRVGFWCPGCDQMHVIEVSGPRAWGFNFDFERPTFTPSVLVDGTYWEPPVTAENIDEWERAPWPQQQMRKVCHSFVTEGRIQFLGDCTHSLAGQTVDLPDLPDRAKDFS